MLSKYATLLAFAVSAIAGAIEPGSYRITNVASQSTARVCGPIDSPIYVSSTGECDGLFEIVSLGLCLCFGIYSNYLPQTTVGC